MRHHRLPLFVVLVALLALPASSLQAMSDQQEAMHWHSDLESAKVVAKETNRLVLVHFWTPSCGPCMALNQNVFNQPGVAKALETHFVPVKLNADENSATAQWFGINRVPTDVIVTPDGQMVGKLISPPTPAAYVAELTAAAGKYATKSGQTFAKAAAAAPAPAQLNAAYANLQLPPGAQLAIAPPQHVQPVPAASAPATSAPKTTQQNNGPPANQDRYASATPAAAAGRPQPLAPQIVTNPAAGAASQPGTPSPALAVTAPQGAPNSIANPYTAATTSAPPDPQQPLAPLISPAQTVPIGYEASTLRPATPGAAAPSPPLPASASAPADRAPSSGAPDPRLLPSGAPPLGFEGYCPVSMRNSWKWVAGDPRWGVVHRGQTYWFAGPEEQKQFWTDPDRYTPALSGMDPVLAIDHQQQVPGKREHSLDYDGLFYMFASEATLQQFTANPQRYAAGVRQAMGIPRGRLVR
jgi:protein disulfide-isomerase